MEDWNEVKARGKRPWWPDGGSAVPSRSAVVFSSRRAADSRAMIRPAAGDSGAMELAHLKMLAHALKLHADEHEGKFPTAISEIEWRQNLPAMKWAGLPAAVSRFHDPESGVVSDWLYYKGRTENDPPDTILVAAPVASGKAKDRRMVARVNDVAEVIAESRFPAADGRGGGGSLLDLDDRPAPGCRCRSRCPRRARA